VSASGPCCCGPSSVKIGAVLVKLRWAFSIAVLAACAALPATAQATLVFVRKPLHPQVWVANDNGGHAHRLLAGSNPHVSPDGKIVALMRGSFASKRPPELVLAPADRSAPPTALAKNWRYPYTFAWSPDSRYVAAVLGPELGKQRLVLIDTEGGSQRTIARGVFSGGRFNPFEPAPGAGSTFPAAPMLRPPEELVYARAGSERYPPRSDIYRFDVPGGEPLRAPEPVRLTDDHRSTNPVWRPNGMIVFARQLGAKQRRFGPKNELYLMSSVTSSEGKRTRFVRRLTHTKVSPLAQGLTPTAWSPSGNRLLAQFGGQDLTYAVAVNPLNGRQRPLVEATEQGFVGVGFSADGRRVLGTTGGFDWGKGTSVATVRYPHGKPKVLARHAFEPSWGG
jgi:Tol biopolymer transport system component